MFKVVGAVVNATMHTWSYNYLDYWCQIGPTVAIFGRHCDHFWCPGVSFGSMLVLLGLILWRFVHVVSLGDPNSYMLQVFVNVFF